jgi:hypothetical protein
MCRRMSNAECARRSRARRLQQVDCLQRQLQTLTISAAARLSELRAARAHKAQMSERLRDLQQKRETLAQHVRRRCCRVAVTLARCSETHAYSY